MGAVEAWCCVSVLDLASGGWKGAVEVGMSPEVLSVASLAALGSLLAGRTALRRTRFVPRRVAKETPHRVTAVCRAVVAREANEASTISFLLEEAKGAGGHSGLAGRPD